MSNVDITNNLMFIVYVHPDVLKLFEVYVTIANVIRVFHRYNVNVLTDKDIQHVIAVKNNSGDPIAAALLFETIIKYYGWFNCTLQVFRDTDVKLTHVAEEMEVMKESFKDFFKNEDLKNRSRISELLANDPHRICVFKQCMLLNQTENLKRELDNTKEELSRKDQLCQGLLQTIEFLKKELENTKENLRRKDQSYQEKDTYMRNGGQRWEEGWVFLNLEEVDGIYDPHLMTATYGFAEELKNQFKYLRRKLYICLRFRSIY